MRESIPSAPRPELFSRIILILYDSFCLYGKELFVCCFFNLTLLVNLFVCYIICIVLQICIRLFFFTDLLQRTSSWNCYIFPFVSMCCTCVCNIGYICANVVWYKVTLYCVMLCYYYYMLCLVHIYTVYKANYWWVYTFVFLFFCYFRLHVKILLEFVFRCKRLLAYSLKVIYSKKDNITDVIVIKNRFCRFKDRHMCALKIKELYPLLYLFIVIINQYCMKVFVKCEY